MQNRDKWLIYAVILLLFSASLLLCLGASAQSRCDTLAHDRPLLDNIIAMQDRRISGLNQANGLLKIRVSLADSSAETIRVRANQTIVQLTQQRDQQQARADTLAKQVKAQPKQPTAVGKLLRKTRDVLAYVGGFSLIATLIRFTW